jgi:ribosomal protein S18 acetylase RimI-like enzyme
MHDWRPMTTADLAAVEVIGARAHPDHPEDPAIFAERLRLYPQGCLVLHEDGCLLGYAVAHPWLFGCPPSLNTLLGALPAQPDTLYIHDIAVLPEARHSGAGAAVLRRLAEQARACGAASLSLVAVGRSHGFWERQGFVTHDDAGLRAKLPSYGDTARFMVGAPQ